MVISTFNFLNTVVVGVGTLIGGILLNDFGNSYHGHMTLFVISSFARAASLIVFPGIILK